jgi:hypothetical protein
MQKRYIVRLSPAERDELRAVVKKFQGSSQKVRRAQMLLKADIEGANWTDQQIAAAFDCRTKTVENVRQRLVERGFEVTLNGQPRARSSMPQCLDGEQAAQVIALRLGTPPEGYANWSLRLLARRTVELGITKAVSHETVRQTLKKTV